MRGAAGMFNGLTIWAMILLVTLSVGIPSLLNVFNLGRVATQIDQATGGGVMASGVDSTLWASLWSVLGALVAAGLGGAIGGLVTRPADSTLGRADGYVEESTTVDDEEERRDLVS